METGLKVPEGVAQLLVAIEASDLALAISALTQDPDLNFEEVTGHTALHRAVQRAPSSLSPSPLSLPISGDKPFVGSTKDIESCNLCSLDQKKSKLFITLSDTQQSDGDGKKDGQCTCCDKGSKSPSKSAEAIVKLLLDKGVSVNLSDTNVKKVDPPLLLAVRGGSYAVVKLLLSQGAYVNAICVKGKDTALTLAAKLSRPDLLCLLLENKADVNKCAGLLSGDIADNFENTAFYAAVKSGCANCVEILLKHGADILPVLPKALQMAVKQCDAPVLQILLQHKPEEWDAEVLSCWGAQSVRWACQKGFLDILNVLLKAGADPNCVDRQGRTPLMLSSKSEIARTLLNYGANPSARFTVSRGDDRTVLETAINNGWVSVAEVLVQSGAHVSNLTLAQAIAMKKCKGKSELITLLLEAGANANFSDSHGTPVLHIAAHQESSVIETLVHFGANLNRQDSRGDTVMMSCVRRLQHGAADILKTLLSLGANVNFVDKRSGQSIMSILMDQALIDVKEWYECVHEIQKYGAMGTKNCNSALTVSIQKYKTKAVKLIVKCGTGPDFVTESDIYKSVSSSMLKTLQGRITPFMLSLLTGKSTIAEFFLDNLFMTSWDMKLVPSNKQFRYKLQDHQHLDCLALLDRSFAHPFSLFDLTFVAVSTALGPAPGREARVRNTGLPPAVQRRLLFQHDQ